MIMINELRKKIDKVDRKIAKQLLKRYKVITKIAQIKQKNQMPVHNKSREDKHLQDILNNFTDKKNFKNYLSKIFHEIFRISRDIQ